ncbi:acyltransferase family protein [Levilactobacillus enshiensis]|uniref:acyltransferase family protein n=1 Tax=Levilactobacillus enshiensis TaxID=2590213 RepID=UPI00131E144A|nr:acyltransferase [Levilactobacillus enshiensis]
MRETKTRENQLTDVGDYLKAFACTAVMGQTVLSLGLTTAAGQAQRVPLAWLYAAIKFTAPAFICGILFSTMRLTRPQPPLHRYYRQQWHALGVPTLWWTLAYLLILPGVQQHRPAHTVSQFLWQLVNGNAAPHLWYNAMMLQIVLLMPIWWGCRRWATTAKRRCLLLGTTALVYALGMWAYMNWIYTTTRYTRWYLVDRVFVGFIPYAVLGITLYLAWPRVRQWRWLAMPCLLLGGLSLSWQARQLLRLRPLSFTRSSYYLPANVLYALSAIGLITSLAIWQLRQHSRWLPVIHWVATYAYRAYLANVFWLTLIWLAFGRQLTSQHLGWGLWLCYILTWAWSFTATYLLHVAWQKIKIVILNWRKRKCRERNQSN